MSELEELCKLIVSIIGLVLSGVGTLVTLGLGYTNLALIIAPLYVISVYSYVVISDKNLSEGKTK